MSQRILLIAMLLVPALGWTAENQAGQADVLSLEQAVALALDHNRNLKNAELEVSKQEDSVAEAGTKRRPSFKANLFGSIPLQRIDITFKQGDFGTFPGPGGRPNPATDVTISTPRTFNPFAYVTVDQPLTQLYRIILGMHMAKINFQLASEDLRS